MHTTYRVKSNQGRCHEELFDDIAKAVYCLRQCEKCAQPSEKWFVRAYISNAKCEEMADKDLSDEYVKGVESAIKLAQIAYKEKGSPSHVAEVLTAHLGDEPDYDTPADFEKGLKETMKAAISRYEEKKREVR